MSRPVCNALWVGPSIGPVESACLSSFVAAGHQVDLYSYENPSGVPAGVNLLDANAILPHPPIARYRSNGSPSLFSNRFRYALLAAGKHSRIRAFGHEDRRNARLVDHFHQKRAPALLD